MRGNVKGKPPCEIVTAYIFFSGKWKGAEMTREEFDKYCAALPAATHVIQWGGASVWKVGGKIFAICSIWGEGEGERISFKCSDIGYMALTERDGIIPAPYLARAKWVQVTTPEAMNDAELKEHIMHAYDIVKSKLTRAQRAELGI
tara:strand:- start:10642 stop:11079 length:438 start_codon:yes stop_codon:yes gene_type:complete